MIQFQRTAAALTSCLLAAGMFSCIPSQAQMVQTPIVSVYAGIPATTYNGSTLSGTICAGALDAFGDGCPATQATLDIPRGVANDVQGNVFITEQAAHQLRVVYQGGSALAAALTAGNPGRTFTPTAGYIYSLGAGTTGTPTLFSGAGVYCNGTSGAKTLDTSGDGCPAQYFVSHPFAIAIDPQDNIFFGDEDYPSSGSSVHIFYVGGTAAANLITTYNPSVTTPQVGYVYALSVTGGTTSSPATSDFVNVISIAVDTNDNIYASDNGSVVSATSGILASTIGGQIKKFVGSPVAGWTTFMTNVGNVAGTANGDGGPATSATFGNVAALGFDLNNNLYIADTTNDSFRTVYFTAGSQTPPLYVNQASASNASITAIANPVVGNIYTVVGGTTGGSNRHTGNLASGWVNVYPNELGFDQAGNLLLMIDQQIVRVAQSTGIATILSNLGATGTGSASSAPAAGVYCNNGTAGPTMTNAYADGCPASQVLTIEPTCCRISADSQGNFYLGDYRASSGSIGSVIQKYTFNGQFGMVATGSSATEPIAFVPSVYNTTYAATTSLNSGGNSTSEFSDAGTGDYCVSGSAGETNGYQTCVFNISFTPAQAGTRVGGLALSTSSAALGSFVLGGVGSGAQISIDPATQTTIGTGLTPYGAALDQAGDYYIASGTSTGVVYKSTAGGAPVSFATGFNAPKQVAVNGAGTVYVADSGNNRVAAVTQAGAVSSFLASPFHLTVSSASTSLSSPSGVAVDAAGDVFVSDTGNNRVIEFAATGTISTLGFSGLSSPLGIAVDSSADVFVADSGNKRVVELSTSGVQTVVSVTPALTTPVGVAVDAAGNLYVADSGNQNVVLVPLGSTTATTLLANNASLTGLAADDAGDVVISASGSAGLVKLNRTAISYTFPGATPSGSTQTSVFTLTDTGNAALTVGASLGSSTDSTDFSLASATTNGCTLNQSILPGGDCSLAATFAPRTNAGMITDTVTFPASNAANGASAKLIGNTVIVVPTTTTVTAVTPVAYGANITVTVQVTPASGSAAAPGTVTITQNGTVVSTATLSATGSATYTVTAPIPGTYSMAASYSGAYGFGPSSTTGVSVVVTPPPADFTLTLASSTGTVSYGNSIINTVTVTAVQYSGYNLATTLSCAGAPNVSSCTVVAGSVTPTATTPATAIVTLQTGSLVGSLRTGHGGIEFALTVFGAAGLFGLVGGRRKRWPRLLAVLLCVSTLAAMSGCSSNAATYNLTVTASGTGGQIHAVTWTVKVQ